MAAYEPKISPYTPSTRYSSYQICSFSSYYCNCSHVRVGNESYNIYCHESCPLVGVVATPFSYFSVFRILRRHQCLVQTNENAIDIRRNTKSLAWFFFFAIFVLSYIPYMCCMLVFFAIHDIMENLYLPLRLFPLRHF